MPQPDSACCSMLGCHVPQIPRGLIGKDVAVQSLPVTKDSVRCHCVQHGGAQAIEAGPGLGVTLIRTKRNCRGATVAAHQLIC